MQINQIVRTFREKRGFSLKQVAEKAGLSSPQLSEIELGKREPTLKTLMKIADACNIPFESFLVLWASHIVSKDDKPDEAFLAHVDTLLKEVYLHKKQQLLLKQKQLNEEIKNLKEPQLLNL